MEHEHDPWQQDAETLESILDRLGFPLKHLDHPSIAGALGACGQEQTLYLIEVLEGHIDTLMTNDGVKQAIANAMKKGH